MNGAHKNKRDGEKHERWHVCVYVSNINYNKFNERKQGRWSFLFEFDFHTPRERVKRSQTNIFDAMVAFSIKKIIST